MDLTNVKGSLDFTISLMQIGVENWKTWAGAYMKLDEDDPAINCFWEFEVGPILTELVNCELPPQVKGLE